MSSGKHQKYLIPSNKYGKIKQLTEPGPEMQKYFYGKLHNKKIPIGNQKFTAVDRLSKWPNRRDL